jgi:putative membrane protein
MSAQYFLLHYWAWRAAPLLGCLLGIAAYATVLRRKAVLSASVLPPTEPSLSSPKSPLTHFAAVTSARPWLFGIAVLVFLLALVSPVETLADGYLFSAHMLQHLLLLMVVPALALLSLPAFPNSAPNQPARGGARTLAGSSTPLAGRPRFARVPGDRALLRTKPRALPSKCARAVGLRRFLTSPLPAWCAGVGAMWLWHAPTLCNAATTNPAVRGIQTVSLLMAGAFFWWPILGPQWSRRLPPLLGIIYLFTACTSCTLLGIFITFSPVTVCSAYGHPVDALGLLPLIRNRWGLTAQVDQQIGGLLMWVPACLIYLSGILGLLARWYRDAEMPLPASSSIATGSESTIAQHHA